MNQYHSHSQAVNKKVSNTNFHDPLNNYKERPHSDDFNSSKDLYNPSLKYQQDDTEYDNTDWYYRRNNINYNPNLYDRYNRVPGYFRNRQRPYGDYNSDYAGIPLFNNGNRITNDYTQPDLYDGVYPYPGFNRPFYNEDYTTAPGTPNVFYDYDDRRYENNYDGTPYDGMPYGGNMFIPVLPLYGYDDSQELGKDLTYVQRLYPNTARIIQDEIDQEFNNLDYDEQILYGEFPDKAFIDQMVNRINEKLTNNAMLNNTREINDTLTKQQPCVYDLITLVLLNEIVDRRRNFRRSRYNM